MTREEAKEHIKSQLESYLTSKGINTRKNFKCLICGKGSKTPNMGYKNNKIHCFSCGADMDIIDLIGCETGRSGGDLFNYCYEYFNLNVEDDRTSPNTAQNGTQSHKAYKITATGQAPLKMQNKGYTAYIMECKAHISETDYFLKRGLSPATIDRYNLGYDPVKKIVVIPYSKANSYYIARSIDGKAYFKLNSNEAGAEPIYNMQALYNKENKPVFVAEGQIDALSIIEAGAAAIGAGGTNGVNKIISQLKAKPTSNTLILSLDNDKAGQEAAAKLETELQAANIKYVKANISGEYKDPNEALTANRNLFLKAIQDANEQAAQYAQDMEDAKKAEAEAEREKYINETSVTAHIDDFIGQIKKSADTPAIPTNFTELDKVLDDGLYEGLYVVGAISSLGKTSLVLQIADQIAQQRQDVLIFSLEMAKTELMAKSISRITYEITDDKNIKGESKKAKTARGITASKKHKNYSVEEKRLINESVNKYASYTDYLYIYEGLGDIGAEKIRRVVEEHIKATGNKPVVVVDYLQILAPYDPRATDKQATDRNVFDLKRLSRDFKLPVIGISSLNRESYTTNISMKAFKESGSIEYSSDVLIGLQFEAMSEDEIDITEKNINKWKRDLKRKIELKILKNRNGATGDSITFDYYPMFNYFHETGRKEVEDNPSEPAGAVRGKAGRKQ